MFLNLNKGDKVKYLGNIRYSLANGQIVTKEGEEIMISSNVKVQKRFFNKIEEKKEEKVEKKDENVNQEVELNKNEDENKKEKEEIKKEQPKRQRQGRPKKK